jgi:S1-C subfamily serine protease
MNFKLDVNYLDLLIKEAQAPVSDDPIKKTIQRGLQSSCSIYCKSDGKQWSGSGFHVGDGLIITAGHVVPLDETITEINVTFDNQSFFPAKFIASNPDIDTGSIYCESAKSFPKLEFGDSAHLELGDIVVVIGSPEGFHDTATVGRVSNIHQTLGNQAPSKAWQDIIFIDADILEGSSGGMVLGLDGLVYGIVMGVTGQHSDVGIGENSISPSNKIRDFISKLV